jgi:hypothetical protein
VRTPALAHRSRTIVRIILNGSTARTACGIPAGIRTVSPARATTFSPPMVSSTRYAAERLQG